MPAAHIMGWFGSTMSGFEWMPAWPARLKGPCPTLPCPAPPCPALPRPALPCPALPCPALPCLALPCPALPCPALPCLALPCPALPCPGSQQPTRPPTAPEASVLARGYPLLGARVPPPPGPRGETSPFGCREEPTSAYISALVPAQYCRCPHLWPFRRVAASRRLTSRTLACAMSTRSS